jgi:hypothetical protein
VTAGAKVVVAPPGGTGGSGITQLTSGVIAGPGTGNQAATLASILGSPTRGPFTARAIYDVKDYGALGDGSTDDTTAIQSCINAAPSGSIVYFPPGTYIVSATIQLSGNITYMGADSGVSVVKQKSGSNLNAVMASLGWTAGTNATSVAPTDIYRLQVQGQPADSGNGHGIVLQSYQSSIEYCYVQSTKGDGIRFDTASQSGSVTVSNTMVENHLFRCQVRTTTGAGINIADATNNKLTDGWIRDCIVQNPGGNGVNIQASAGWVVAGCHVYGCNTNGIACSFPYQTRIVDNYVEQIGGSATNANYCAIDFYNGFVNDGGDGSVIANNCIRVTSAGGNASSSLIGIGVQVSSGGTGNVVITGNIILGITDGTTATRGITLVNQNSGSTLNAAVFGNNISGWNSSMLNYPNGGTMNVATSIAGSDTSLTTVISNQALVSGTTYTPSTATDVELTFNISTAGTMTFTMGPTTGTENTVFAAGTAVAIGSVITKRIPKGWKFVLTLASAVASNGKIQVV